MNNHIALDNLKTIAREIGILEVIKQDIIRNCMKISKYLMKA